MILFFYPQYEASNHENLKQRWRIFACLSLWGLIGGRLSGLIGWLLIGSRFSFRTLFLVAVFLHVVGAFLMDLPATHRQAHSSTSSLFDKLRVNGVVLGGVAIIA